MDARCGGTSLRAEANALSVPPGVRPQRLKLKELTGARTSSGACGLIRKQREEPYQGLTYR